MKKKLLVTASTFPRWREDTEPRFILDLSLQLTDEFDVTILVPATPGAHREEIWDGIKIIRYHYFPIHRWETLCYPGAIVPRIKEKKIRAFLVPFLFLSLYFHLIHLIPKYDIVHAHWLIPQGIIQSFFRKTYIVTGHGGDVTSLNKGIIKRLKQRCLKQAAYVTVVSEQLKKKTQDLESGIVPYVISMGVDTTLFGDQYRIPNYFQQNDKKVILFVGRLAEKKGVNHLINAMEYVDALLVIIGDGPLRKVLEKQASRFGNKIKFWGTKTHEELKTIYASADLFVCPSITAKDGDQEGLPLVLLEAMASGLPVIATTSGGITQLIQNEVNGLLCEEKNEKQLAKNINRMLTDEQFYHQIIENTKMTVIHYDYKTIGNKYAELIKSAINKGN